MTRNTAEFTELLKPHYNDAIKYSRALCATWSADDAEDVLQQSFLLALENFHNLNDTTKFRSWFFKIITTTFYSAIRKHFWKKFLPMDDSGFKVPDMPEIYDRAEQSESRMVLNKALAVLSAKERAAILLFEVAGFSIEEIVTIQKERSLSAVKSRLSRARKKLKEHITEQGKYSVRSDDLYRDLNGDLETETLNLIAEIRSER